MNALLLLALASSAGVPVAPPKLRHDWPDAVKGNTRCQNCGVEASSLEAAAECPGPTVEPVGKPLYDEIERRLYEAGAERGPGAYMPAGELPAPELPPSTFWPMPMRERVENPTTEVDREQRKDTRRKGRRRKRRRGW